MGDPRKARAQFKKPKKPFNKVRLDAELILTREYGLQNKQEIFRSESLLRKFASQAKKLMSATGEQAEQEQKALLGKLQSLALIGADAQLDDVLALDLKNILERRLQTQVLRAGLANTIKQARQFIVHNHIQVNGKSITFPSHIISKEDESKITFVESSSIAKEDHPERPEQIFKMKEAIKLAKSAPKKEEAEEVKEEAKPVEEKKEEPAEEVKEEAKSEESTEATETKEEVAEEKTEEKPAEEKKEEEKPAESPKEESKPEEKAEEEKPVEKVEEKTEEAKE